MLNIIRQGERVASEISSKEHTIYLREREYLRYLRCESERAFSAKNLGLKECQRCGFCCLGVPCVPKPDEIEPIARFLDLAITELVRKYMVIDKFEDTNYFLGFAKEGQEDITGTYLPEERWFDHGYCILFAKEEKSCKIYPVRPFEGRDWNCWDVKPRYIKVANTWGRDDIYKFVPDFQKSD